MASGSMNLTSFRAKTINLLKNHTNNLEDFNIFASTSYTANELGETNSFAIVNAPITGRPHDNHGCYLNIKSISTPFQIMLGDSSMRYIYKRYYSDGAWQSWFKLDAGHADTWTTARTLTVGGTGKSVDGSANVSWSMNEIMGSSDSTKFYRGDKIWSNTLAGQMIISSGNDVTTTGSTGYLIIGSTSGTSIGIDDNEIMCRSSGSASTLYLQGDGGALQISGNTTISAALISRSHRPEANNSYNLGTNSYRWSTIYGNVIQLDQLSGPANPSLSSQARIEFTYSGGNQPVNISYTPNDDYRAPAGLKIMGGTSASPTWLEVEGTTYSSGGYTITSTENHWRDGYLKVQNSSGGDCYLTLDRNSKATFRLLNSGGDLYLQSDYNSGKTSFHNTMQITHSYCGIYAYDHFYVAYSNSPTLYLYRGTSTNWRMRNDDAVFKLQCSYYNGANQSSGNSYTDFMTIQHNSGNTWIKGTLSINGTNLYFPSDGSITWSSGSWWQRITTANDSSANTPVFYFQQSEGTSGSSWKTLCEIYDNQRVYAAGGFFAGNGYLNSNTGYVYNSSANWAQFEAQNGNGACSILCATNKGLYDNNTGYWIVAKSYGNSYAWSDYQFRAPNFVCTSTSGENHMAFSRTGGHNSPNYLNVPSGSSFAFSVGGASGSNIVAMIESTGLVPFSNNTKSVGTSSYKWNYMYASVYYVDSSAYHSQTECRVYNGNGTIGLYCSTNRGIYDYTGSKWIAACGPSRSGYAWSDYGFYNAVWNDFAEFRASDVREPGYAIAPASDGRNYKTTSRMQPSARIISDTFGFATGYSAKAQTPVGLAGRVLAYPYQQRDNYRIGDCVCAAPGGTIDIMSRQEIQEYPDRIIGIVNEIPDYEVWEQESPKNEGGGRPFRYQSMVASGQTSNNPRAIWLAA